VVLYGEEVVRDRGMGLMVMGWIVRVWGFCCVVIAGISEERRNIVVRYMAKKV
jgi:hypothetical protein